MHSLGAAEPNGCDNLVDAFSLAGAERGKRKIERALIEWAVAAPEINSACENSFVFEIFSVLSYIFSVKLVVFVILVPEHLGYALGYLF